MNTLANLLSSKLSLRTCLSPKWFYHLTMSETAVAAKTSLPHLNGLEVRLLKQSRCRNEVRHLCRKNDLLLRTSLIALFYLKTFFHSFLLGETNLIFWTWEPI